MMTQPNIGKSELAAIGEIVRRNPVSMHAADAARVLGICRNTFFFRVREGSIRYVQDSPRSRRKYLTEHVLEMRGIKREFIIEN